MAKKRGRPRKKPAPIKEVPNPLERADFLTSPEFEKQVITLEKIYEEYESNNVHKKLDFLNSEINKLNKEVEITANLRKNIDYLSRALKELPLDEVKEVDELYSRTDVLKNKVRELQHNLVKMDHQVSQKFPKVDPKNIKKELREDLGLFEDDLMGRFKGFESKINSEFSKLKNDFLNIHGGIKEHKESSNEKSDNLESRLRVLEHRMHHLTHAQNILDSDLRRNIPKSEKSENKKLEIPSEILEKINKLEERQGVLENQLNLEEVKIMDNEIQEINSKINNLKNDLIRNEKYVYSLRDDMKNLLNFIEKNILIRDRTQATIIQ